MAIKLEDHIVFVDKLKMDMVPYSIAIQAVEQAANLDTEQYAKDLENAMTELNKALSNIQIND